MARPGIMLYFDILEPIRVLPDADKGRLLVAMLEYGEFGTVPQFDGMLALAWGFIRPKLDRDEGSYENAKLQRKYAAFCKRRTNLNLPKIPFEEWLAMDEDERQRMVTADNEPQRPVDSVNGRYPTTTAAATSTVTPTAAVTLSPSSTVTPISTAAAAVTGENFAAATAEQREMKMMGGELGKGVVLLSQEQTEDLAALDNIDVKEHLASCYYDLHEDIKTGAHTFYNLPGGRGSCKSSTVSLEIVDGIMRDPTGLSNAIVFRYIANTMRESVFSQIAWAIDTLGVNHLWWGGVSPMQYTYLPTGAQITFRGLDDATKLKSIKPKRGVFKYIWFEEFSELPGVNFLRSVQQSVMRGGSDFTLFRTFNPPISKNNWANVYIQEPDSKALTLLTDYTMIPREWLGENFLYEAERLRELNPMAFLHEYMGQPTGTGGEVFPHLEIREITDTEIREMEYLYNGLDFGFAVDPACFMRVCYDRKHDVVYLVDEIYKRGCSNKQLAQVIKERGYSDESVTADCAEPKSISDLREEGLMSRACHKEPGCVAYRVKWLQHRRIIIDPARTPNAYREFTNYSYEADKDGNFLPSLPDRDNHSIDAVAYALDKLIYRRGVSA